MRIRLSTRRQVVHATILIAAIAAPTTTSAAIQLGTTYQIIPSVTAAASLRAIDVNRDGIMDLVVTGSSNSVWWHRGLQGGGYAPLVPLITLSSTVTQWDAGDINNDGKIDFVIADAGQNGWSVLGNGDGTFQTPRLILSLFWGACLKLGDLDGDGLVDMVAAATFGPIYIMKGFGDGRFQVTSTMYPPPVFPIDLAIADFDGDSHPDVMVVDFPTTTGTVTSPGALDFFRGLPGGLLDTPVVILMPGTPTSIAVGDLDEDGLPDAMVVNVGGGTGGVNVASIVYGARVGTPFGRLNLNADGLRSLAAIDLDGDGHPELVAAEASTYTDQIEVFGRTAPRFYTSLRNYPAGSSPQHMVFTDTNGDGNRDIVACNSGLSRLVVLHGHGGLDFGDGGEVHTVAQEAGLDAGDVNGDHIPDVVAVQSGTSGVAGVHLGKGDGTFLPMTSTVGPIACCGQTAARLVDVNDDGRLDLVGLVGFYDRFEVDLGDGLGHFTAGPSRSLNSGTHGSMVFSDFNEDGVPDAAIACEGGIAICLGMSGGAFGAPTLLAPNEKFVATGDFNRDGHADLISTNSALEFEFGSQISVYLGHGDGTFTMLPTFYGGYKPTTFAVGDLNGDGVPDLAISNYGDPSIAIFVGTGNGTFLAGPVFPGVWAMSLAIADLDGDGAPDLIGTIADAACVRVWPGLGGAQFGTPIDFGMRSHPDILKVADLDRDGRPDLVVGHLYKGTFDALVNQTAGPPVLVLVSNVEATVDRGHVRLVWYSVASELYLAHVERTDGDSWKDVGTVHSDRADYATFEEDVPDGEYDYRLGLSESGQSVREGEVHVSVHTVARLAIDACRWNASAAAFEATLSLATVSPARLSVIDVSGRVVADDQWTPDGVGHQAREIESRARTASGVYWARLEQGGRTITRRVMVLE